MSFFSHCLGRRPERFDPRTFRLESLVQLPAAAPACDNARKLPDSFGMMLNDKIGDCAEAAVAHLIQVYTSLTGAMVTLSDSQVADSYAKITGWNPAEPSTDQGSSMLDVLRYVRANGIGGYGKGCAFVKIDPQNVEHVKFAISAFGGVYIGADMPLTAREATPWLADDDGTGDGAPNSWGGHAMASAKYDRSGPGFLTWGVKHPASWTWWLRYVSECYVILAREYVDGTQPSPSGFDIGMLRDALTQLEAA